MTEIDVPDWVVEIAGSVLADHALDGDGPAHEALRAALTAALGAWVVPEYAAVEYSNEHTSYRLFYDRAKAQAFLDQNDSEASLYTLYTLRQEKPE